MDSTLLYDNWAGEVDTGTTYTGVSADWVVPTVVSSGATQVSATWIGIDGASNSDLIQTGTTQQTSGGSTSYFAWWEILPASASPIAEPVYPDDEMEAAIYEDSPGTWTIRIEDVTQGWVALGNVNYFGPADSAEWIEEAPVVNGQLATLADFGAVQFTHLGISSSDLSASILNPAYMVNGSGTVLAYPGAFDTATDSFVTVYGSPPRPVISAISPTQGPTSGGTTVTIYFVDGVEPSSIGTVQFGSTAAGITDDAQAGSAGWLTVIAPAEAAGTVDVTVTTLGGTSASSPADQFTYLAPPPPSPPPPTTSPAPVSTPVTYGYDLVGSDGGVFVFPPPGTSGGFYGSLPGLDIHVNDIVGMVPTSNDQGYFLVGSDGGVFAFGNAPFLGSLPGLHVVPRAPIVGIVPTGNDQGYFLVGKDGGVFAFGNAPFLGSLPGIGVQRNDVIGIAATPSGDGYWVVAADGTVYAFGAAQQLGSATGTPSPVAAIAGTPDGGGYWIVTQNGSVYAFGDADYFGSLPGIGVTPAQPVIGIVNTSDGGYWLIARDGGIFAFGDAPYVGSLPGDNVHVTNVVGAVPTLS
ncbi:MAG: G1 family glutamic endopeptidase [Acidimicrobiales bacterium]